MAKAIAFIVVGLGLLLGGVFIGIAANDVFDLQVNKNSVCLKIE